MTPIIFQGVMAIYNELKPVNWHMCQFAKELQMIQNVKDC